MKEWTIQIYRETAGAKSLGGIKFWGVQGAE